MEDMYILSSRNSRFSVIPTCSTLKRSIPLRKWYTCWYRSTCGSTKYSITHFHLQHFFQLVHPRFPYLGFFHLLLEYPDFLQHADEIPRQTHHPGSSEPWMRPAAASQRWHLQRSSGRAGNRGKRPCARTVPDEGGEVRVAFYQRVYTR